MIVAESIGFAGTHTITSILAAVPGVEVSHGSQHFEARGALGTGSQTPQAFVASMTEAAAKGAHPIAVHCLFDPAQFKPACEAAGITYSLLVRKPEAQIASCYAWAMRKILNGDASAFIIALKNGFDWLSQLRVAQSLPNLVFAYAASHVCRYNLSALALGAPLLRMEELLNDEAAFRAAFALPEDAPLPHFSGEKVQISSHRAKTAELPLAEPDRAAILSRAQFQINGRGWSVPQLAAALGYA